MEQKKFFKNNILGYEFGCSFPNDDHFSQKVLSDNKMFPMIPVEDNRMVDGNRLNFLLETYPDFFNSFIKINIDSMKVNVVERYYFYCIEAHELNQRVEKEITTQEHKADLLQYFNNCLDFYLKKITLKIKNIYGLMDIEEYLKSKETILIDNPSLLGLCQIIFSKDDFKILIYHDILYSKNSLEDLRMIISKIAYSIIEAKERIIFFDESIHWIFKHNYSRENILKTLGLTDLENFAKEKSKKELKTIITSLIKEYSPIVKIILRGKYTQGKLIGDISGKVFKEKNKDSKNKNLFKNFTPEDKETLLNEIKNFVYKYFQNGNGKSGTYDSTLKFNLLSNHIDNLKKGLSNLKEGKIINELQISKIISNAFPNSKAVKTIQNI